MLRQRISDLKRKNEGGKRGELSGKLKIRSTVAHGCDARKKIVQQRSAHPLAREGGGARWASDGIRGGGGQSTADKRKGKRAD